MQVQKIQGVNNTGVNNTGVNKGAEVNFQTTKNSHNPSFGYNAGANAELIKFFDSQKKNKAYYRYLKELVTSTNKAEKELREAERKDKPYLMTGLIATFLPAKILLTNMVNALFPPLDYRKKELEAYSEEIEKREDIQQNPVHWMNTLTETLSEQQKQDEAEKMANVLSTVMHEIFPEQQFDFSALSPMFRQEYVENDSGYNDISEDLQQRIELGKSKVFHYEPKDKNELKGFASLGGMKELKKQLTEDIIIPLKNPAKAKYNEEHYGIKRPSGILFYGPPGCGKTTIVERLSVETGLPLLELTTDSFGSEYINGSEINLGAVFDYAASIATEEKPVILFIDDVDGIVGNRNAFMHDHKKSELAVFLKRVQEAPKNNIIVMAATNNYDGIDKAFTSRLRQQIYTGLPDKDARKSIIKMKLEETDNGRNLANDENALDRIAELTESFPIRALEDFATETRKMAFINGIRDITLADYEKVISKPESQNKKIKEDNYKTNATKKSIGFNTIVGGPKTIG